MKKNIVTLTISTCLMVMFSQSSMARPPHGDGKDNTPPNAASVLDRMDYDGNGEVTVDDFINRSLKRADRYFARLDKDDDTLISAEEFSHKRSLHHHDLDIDEVALKQCIEETSGLTVTERPDIEEVFSSIDVSSDSFLTANELIEAKETQAIDRFNDLDDDTDGIISEAEIAAHIEERRALHEVKKSCIEEQLLLQD